MAKSTITNGEIEKVGLMPSEPEMNEDTRKRLIREAWLAQGWIVIGSDGEIEFKDKPSEWIAESEWALLKYLFHSKSDFKQMCNYAGYKPNTVLALLSLDSNGIPLRD